MEETNERHHEVANEKLVEALKISRRQAEEREQKAQRQIAEAKKWIVDAMNPATREREEAIINLKAKILHGYANDGFKLTNKELELIWIVLGKQQIRYACGDDHVCEFADGDVTSGCIVCGESL